MRFIAVPEDITVRPPPEVVSQDPNAKPEVMSFRKFAVLVWLNDQRAIAGGFAKQVRWARVVEAILSCEPRDVISVEDEDYATLKTIVEAPQVPLVPMVAVQLLAFSRAVLDARDKAPETVALSVTAQGVA